MSAPFTISVPDSSIELLRKKLELAVFPDELERSGRKYGPALADIKRLVAYWKDRYDWRKHEAQLNHELPQFTRDIEVEGHGTLNVHYVHKESENPNAIPLLFVHGWPGSFLEVQKILPLLIASSPEHPSFHVVSLSLPGFGFSQAPSKQGFIMPHYAEVCNKLMISLGYDRYVTQGGDWGHQVTRNIASIYGGKHAQAWHTTHAFTFAPPDRSWFWSDPISYLKYLVAPYNEAEKVGLERAKWFKTEGYGYNHQQSTQPQTLGYAVADSPVGLLAWIYEKLVNWTDSYPWDDDEVLTWVSIYYFSRSGPTAASRIYYEIVHDEQNATRGIPTIPMGVSTFPQDLVPTPRTWLPLVGNLVQLTWHKDGGHFPAHERPKELVDDVRKMYAKGGPAYSIVPGRTGYA